MYPCTLCDKQYGHPCTLKLHVRYHSGDYKKACDYCEFAWMVGFPWVTHMKKHHNEIVDYEKQVPKRQCPYCPKKFMEPIDLKLHINFHKGDYRYLCKYCERGYSGQNAAMHYSRHM